MGESYSGGTLGGLYVTNRYDQWLRRTNLTVYSSTTPIVQHAFGYNNASRLQTVTDNSGATAYSATYSYLANSPLVSQIQYKQASTVRMTTSKSYDFLNRLTQISNAPTASSPVSFGYSYNSADQRVRCTLADGSYWVYLYDSLGQVISGHKFFPDETPVAGQQFDYSFDNIGNRTQALAGGDQNGANQRLSTYTVNNLNQYTQRTVPGNVDVIGVGFATNAVLVNGQTAYRKGEYFRQQLNVTNSTTALWTNITVTATNQTSISGYQFIPKTAESFGYDADGNLTNDGRWIFTWDAENRLVQVVTNTSVGPQQLIKFEYDTKGRRIHKQVWPNTLGNGNPTNDIKFVYDGWNLVAILNSASTLQQGFMWGLDLSGSTHGAGGVGGLLGLVYYGAQTTNSLVGFNGNGDVASLINGADGSSLAQYEYGIFGETVRATGPMARIDPFRFSTKYQDDETDLLYYGYRFYHPSAGRWTTSDPLLDGRGPARARSRSDLNRYAFAQNTPTDAIDLEGLITIRRRPGNLVACGGINVDYDLDLNTTPICKGFLVQHLRMAEVANSCDRAHNVVRFTELWEALGPPDEKREIQPFEANDSEHDVLDQNLFLNPLRKYGDWRGHGFIALFREVRYFCMRVTGDLRSLWGETIPNFNTAPITTTRPTWWDNGDAVWTSRASNLWKLDWNCCCRPWQQDFTDTAPGDPLTYPDRQ